MAWNTPRTWVSGELVTALLMNEQIRDNMNILSTYISDTGEPSGFMLVRAQGSDLTKNTDATLEDLDNMSFPIGASESWLCLAGSSTIGNGTADVKYSFTAPAGATGLFGATGAGGASTTAGTSTVFGDPVDVAIPNTATQLIILFAVVVNSVTPGTVQIQAAQNTSTAVNTVFHANSGLVAVRIF